MRASAPTPVGSERVRRPGRARRRDGDDRGDGSRDRSIDPTRGFVASSAMGPPATFRVPGFVRRSHAGRGTSVHAVLKAPTVVDPLGIAATIGGRIGLSVLRHDAHLLFFSIHSCGRLRIPQARQTAQMVPEPIVASMRNRGDVFLMLSDSGSVLDQEGLQRVCLPSGSG